ncbi:hypothetical protein NE237_009194 [Protea cynaroides]|uniref:Uncharacterized protein n=1 Tax=Protea cynaroides TaxID=273540 RepID=A0A9Q0KY38_9MAGN|nr:hypothetical protein NE237_009194 [Protea cynaroides]
MLVHSMALTADGSVFYWNSANPERCQQLYSVSGRNVISISAGKYWAAAVTDTGDVYMWDGRKSTDEPPVTTRLHSVKRVTSVSVGETHMLFVCAIYHPSCEPKLAEKPQEPALEVTDELEELDKYFMFTDMEKTENREMTEDGLDNRCVPSLKSLCEKVAVQSLVEPKNAIQLLEIADALGADGLRKHCEEMAVRSLDYIFTVSTLAIASSWLDILAKLEILLDSRSSEPWSYRRLPTPTATFPVIVNSDEEDNDSECFRVRANPTKSISKDQGYQGLDCFQQNQDATDPAILKAVRDLRKKLQQLGVSVETDEGASSSILLDGKGKKLDVPRKRRRKNKQKRVPVEAASGSTESGAEPVPVKGFMSIEIPQTPNHKDINLKLLKVHVVPRLEHCRPQ